MYIVPVVFVAHLKVGERSGSRDEKDIKLNRGKLSRFKESQRFKMYRL